MRVLIVQNKSGQRDITPADDNQMAINPVGQAGKTYHDGTPISASERSNLDAAYRGVGRTITLVWGRVKVALGEWTPISQPWHWIAYPHDHHHIGKAIATLDDGKNVILAESNASQIRCQVEDREYVGDPLKFDLLDVILAEQARPTGA